MSQPTPFTVDVPQEKLDRIRRRVAEYPWDTVADLGDWRFGPPVGYIRRVADYWLSPYDWRVAERELDRFPHFKAEVQDGLELHFSHERGSGTDPVAVVLIHGWPTLPPTELMLTILPGGCVRDLFAPSSARKAWVVEIRPTTFTSRWAHLIQRLVHHNLVSDVLPALAVADRVPNTNWRS